ncbi:hypothetical protein [Alteromonas halophila]|uniref:Uncharacterized protein n=1 Tax=Alteromonas halophila TaxID=516698 RepID=A0A918JJ07_9ALTE|nr:hypothetical protein [Alteromonas halophila]GGW79721.1 hypothetical protein GCM10007391_10660 [Alteromonas halophila]
MFENKIVTDLTALFGAITGTLALVFQYYIYTKDRSRLRLIPSMAIVSSLTDNPIDRQKLIDFKLDVVNTGRRVAFVESVHIEVRQNWWRRFFSPKVKIGVFDGAESKRFVQINEGEKEHFSLNRWTGSFNVIASKMAKNEKVVVTLTTGEEVSKWFETVKPKT